MNLKSLIREVPDFPKPGINFYDITTLLQNAAGLRAVIDDLGDAEIVVYCENTDCSTSSSRSAARLAYGLRAIV